MGLEILGRARLGRRGQRQESPRPWCHFRRLTPQQPVLRPLARVRYGPTVKAIPSLHGPYPAGLQTWIHQVAGPREIAVLGV